MPLPYNLSRVLGFFQRTIQAYDIVGGIVDHEFTQTSTESYSFVGVLIPPTDKDLNLFDEGELANGAMVLYVSNSVQLHVNDAIANQGQTMRQTIVVFDNDRFRVKGQSNRSSDGLHRKYTLVRYLEERS